MSRFYCCRMVNCDVRGCGHSSSKNRCRFFGLPKEKFKLKKWQKRLSIKNTDLQLFRCPKVCSCHFVNGDKKNLSTIHSNGPEATFKDLLQCNKKNNRVALIDISNRQSKPHSQKVSVVSSQEDSFSVAQSSGKHLEDLDVFQDISSHENEISEKLITARVAELQQEVQVKSDSIISMQNKIDLLTAQIKYSTNHANLKCLKGENLRMKKEMDLMTQRLASMNLRFELEFIELSDEKVYLHTGIPNKKVFDMLLKTLTRVPFTYYSNWSVQKIPHKEQLLMTLMKLKMNLKHFDLAQRFGCCTATVTNVVSTWVLLMHEILYTQFMKVVPSRQRNQRCLPIVFRTLCYCRMVIDGVEFFCDKPFNMGKQKAAYSSYKHHCTCKALIGIAPNGFIVYVSELYPGSTSDKKIVEHCGVLKHLIAGDMILADKGFLIADILPYGVNLNLPPFLTTNQFTREQVKQTELIARARVHVERSINKVKNFRILSYIPSEMNKLATEMVQVCAALTNLQNPVIAEIGPLV